jgi:hypothetical protein
MTTTDDDVDLRLDNTGTRDVTFDTSRTGRAKFYVYAQMARSWFVRKHDMFVIVDYPNFESINT